MAVNQEKVAKTQTLLELVQGKFSDFIAQFTNANPLIELGVITAALLGAFLICWLLRRYLVPLWQRLRDFKEFTLPEFKPAKIMPLLLVFGGLLAISQTVFTSLDVSTPFVRIVGALALGVGTILFINGFNISAKAKRAVLIVGLIAIILMALGLLRPLFALLDQVGMTVGDRKLTIWGLIKMGALVFAFFTAALYAGRFSTRQINQLSGFNPSLKVLFSKFINVGLLIIAGIMALNLIGLDLTALAVFSGALGVGIGFGLQKIISNFISGIILLLDRSLSPGDVIEIETGNGVTYGWVETLGLRYTSVLTRDGTETLIPNETFITNPVTNWSFTNSKVRRKMPIGIAYDSEVELAMKLCIEAASNVARVLDKPEPVCQLRSFGDSSVNLELRFWIADPKGGVKNVESEVNVNIWKLFRENGIEIPFPQRDITIRNIEKVFEHNVKG